MNGTLAFINRKIEAPESYLAFWNYLDIEITLYSAKKLLYVI